MKIAIASDKAGFELKEKVLGHLKETGVEYEDLGLTDPNGYEPFYTGCDAVCKKIQSGEVKFGILICGTGAGMCICANKHKGIFALDCESVYAAKMCRSVNDANIMTMGGNIVGPGMAFEMVDTFLNTEFTGGQAPERADYLKKLDVKYKTFLKENGLD